MLQLFSSQTKSREFQGDASCGACCSVLCFLKRNGSETIQNQARRVIITHEVVELQPNSVYSERGDDLNFDDMPRAFVRLLTLLGGRWEEP